MRTVLFSTLLLAVACDPVTETTRPVADGAVDDAVDDGVDGLPDYEEAFATTMVSESMDDRAELELDGGAGLAFFSRPARSGTYAILRAAQGSELCQYEGFADTVDDVVAPRCGLHRTPCTPVTELSLAYIPGASVTPDLFQEPVDHALANNGLQLTGPDGDVWAVAVHTAGFDSDDPFDPGAVTLEVELLPVRP
jgi:hypothetical protein